MRFSRMLFGLPFAGLTLVAALTLYSPAPPLDRFGVGVTNVSFEMPSFVLPALPAALVAEHEVIAHPGDAHAVAYVAGNQPLAAWRLAADTTFAVIDPHIVAASSRTTDTAGVPA